MNALTFQPIATRFVAAAAPKLRALRARFLAILDTLAEARMQKAQVEIERIRPMIRTDGKQRIDASSIQR